MRSPRRMKGGRIERVRAEIGAPKMAISERLSWVKSYTRTCCQYPSKEQIQQNNKRKREAKGVLWGSYGRSNATDEFPITFIDTENTPRDFDFHDPINAEPSTNLTDLVNLYIPLLWLIQIRRLDRRPDDKVTLLLIRRDIHKRTRRHRLRQIIPFHGHTLNAYHQPQNKKKKTKGEKGGLWWSGHCQESSS
jgi:hypothetical protein